MKKYILSLCVIAVIAFAGCGTDTSSEITNPWSEWDTLEAAETEIGFEFDVPETAAVTYTACSFSTMKDDMTILEVTYENGDSAVTVRKSQGEGQDISGVYGYDYTVEKEWEDGTQITYSYQSEEKSDETSPVSVTFSNDGYSWAIFAEEGLTDEECDAFLGDILS